MAADLKLNLGSGDKRIPGFVNVDYSPECNPDIVMDFEVFPWKFESNSVSHVIMHHVLEHIGQTPRSFMRIMQELYRICKNNAQIDIAIPHHAHDHFYSDPTHVRPITALTLSLFDKELNLAWRAEGLANSPLALQCGVDFQLTRIHDIFDSEAMADLELLKQKDPLLHTLFMKYGRNMIAETQFELRVIKGD